MLNLLSLFISILFPLLYFIYIYLLILSTVEFMKFQSLNDLESRGETDFLNRFYGGKQSQP